MTGRTLIGSAWDGLRHDRELLALPIVGSVATLLAAAPVVAYTWWSGPVEGVQAYVVGAVLVFLTTAVTTFFGVALAAGADQRMSGGNPTLRSSLAVAWRRRNVIVGWALFAAVVGTVLRVIRERVKLGGWLLALFGDVAWAIATYFVVPAIATTDDRTMDVVRRSARTMKARWGKAVRVELRLFMVWFALLAVAFFGAMAALIVGTVSTVAGVVVGVLTGLVVLVAVLVLQALSAYVRVVLWRYAHDLPVPGFDPSELAAAFKVAA